MKSISILTLVVTVSIVNFSCASKDYSASYSGRSNTSTEKEGLTGRVEKFLMNPNGDVDGFILHDGMQVRFPPHMSSAVTKSVALEDTVLVKGVQRSQDVIMATTIVTTKDARQISVHDKPMRTENFKRMPATSSSNQMSVRGEIDTLLKAPNGDVNGFVLTEGSVVHLPRDIRSPDVTYDVGQYVEVTGYGTENAYGKSVEATAVDAKANY